MVSKPCQFQLLPTVAVLWPPEVSVAIPSEVASVDSRESAASFSAKVPSRETGGETCGIAFSQRTLPIPVALRRRRGNGCKENRRLLQILTVSDSGRRNSPQSPRRICRHLGTARGAVFATRHHRHNLVIPSYQGYLRGQSSQQAQHQRRLQTQHSP